jgi:uncharacterized membrane protein
MKGIEIIGQYGLIAIAVSALAVACSMMLNIIWQNLNATSAERLEEFRSLYFSIGAMMGVISVVIYGVTR